MQSYYGTTSADAEPQDCPDPGPTLGDPGYKAVYPDGYTSWTPKAVFEIVFQPTHTMNFSHALAAMRDGHSVSQQSDGEIIHIDETGDIYTHDGNYWSPMQDDLLAEDWSIVG